MNKNEERFRRGNDAIDRALESMGGDLSSEVSYLCECSDPLCFEEIRLRANQYRHLRAAPGDIYVVIPGHEVESVETVVGRFDEYLVVEKRRQTD